MTDASKSAGDARSTGALGKRSKRAPGAAASRVKAGTTAVRTTAATLVWLFAVVCALFLAVGALLIALKANEQNSVVHFIISGAEKLDGPFSLKDGIFTFAADQDGRVKSALTNWGIAAVVFLLIGKILDRVIRP